MATGDSAATAVLSSIHHGLDSLADFDPRMLTSCELADIHSQISSAHARLDELASRTVPAAESMGAPREAGKSSTTAWLSDTAGVSRPDASKIVKLGRLMSAELELVRVEWAQGRLTTEKAMVIARTVDQLPDWLSLDQNRDAQRRLLSFAQQFNTHDLRRLANHIIEVIDPDGADEYLGRKLAEEEKRARKRTVLSFTRRDRGITTVRADIPHAQAAMLRTALEALCAPRRWTQHTASQTASDDGPDDYSQLDFPQRMGRAFCELIEHLPADKLPKAGGTDATITVSLQYRQLIDDLGSATVNTDEQISAGQARRLACNAGIVPIVLDGDSKILDHGTSRRLHDRAQRTALAHRDGGCCWPRCDRPPGWCESHHLRPFSTGGPTSIDNGALFCAFHHHLLHEGTWAATRAPDGVIEIIPPAHIDSQQRPRRNARHLNVHQAADTCA